MIGKLRQIIRYLDDNMQRSLAYASHQLVAVGVIALFGFVLFHFVWTSWFPQYYENLTLRIIGSGLGLGLILTPVWPTSFRRYLPWYWFVTILYTLSFFFAFYFLMNQASVISALSLLCSIFLLVLLVDLFSLSVLLALGWGIALFCYYLLTPELYFGEEHMEMLIVMAFIVIAGSTVNYKTAMLQQQRLDGMAAAAGMIAHELRTPLLGIKSGAQALARYSPALFHGYEQARNAGLVDKPIRNQRLQHLSGVSQRIISEIDYANTIIDMLLVKAGRENSLDNCQLELCSMALCLEQALSRYPFQYSQGRDLIDCKGDFAFVGSPLLMQHVLFNLMKNALYAIATAQKGTIQIWAETQDKYHVLHFRDTGKGMGPKQLSRLFEHFYTTTFMGTGIGLSFCKLVMDRFGGYIRCDSKLGEYTHFKLYFPKKLLEKTKSNARYAQAT
ncbi:sensor histidine kinase [Legionella sp. W05-934-2]|uniref:sensor histidine kinase n=1 Tax=Legionella sp. W05-934-2 TaxID=1198649 RepID=UPI003462FE32